MGKQMASFETMTEMARRNFFREGKAPTDLLPAVVIRSWERSLQLGLGTTDKRVFSPISRHKKALIEERSRTLISCALPEMEKLHGALGHSGWALACTDAQGIVVRSVCGTSLNFRELDKIFQVGRDVSEAAIGTSAPGCAIAEGRSVVVRAAEHFLDEVQPFACAAVPLHDPAGRLVGALDATRFHRGTPVTVLDPLSIAARAIEHRMLAHLDGAAAMGFHYRSDLLGTPMEALIVFAEDGRLLGANQIARRLLGLDPGTDADVFFSDLVDSQPQRFKRALGGRTERCVVHCKGGMVFEARFEPAHPSAVLDSLRAVAQVARAEAAPPKPRTVAKETSIAPLGSDAAMHKALEVARRAFDRDIPVLVNGETGTGKEVLARWLHDHSACARSPFMAINCSSLPAGLIESELFGYEDGAFTGARRGGAPGKFELARDGTVFLDEIGDMPIELQGRLLRVLQERNFTRLGGTRVIPFEARVVAATHRQLKELVADGRFREDLYYRINGVRVSLPPLRTRIDRTELITTLLAREAGDELAPRLSGEAWQILENYGWPGNIRQLCSVLRLALTLAEGEPEIGTQHLPEELLSEIARPMLAPPTVTLAADASMRDIELNAVRWAMFACDGNISAAARNLGVSRATLYRKLRLLNMAPAEEH